MIGEGKKKEEREGDKVGRENDEKGREKGKGVSCFYPGMYDWLTDSLTYLTKERK